MCSERTPSGKTTIGSPCPVCRSDTVREEVKDKSLVGGCGWIVNCTNPDCDHRDEDVPPEVGEAEREERVSKGGFQ